MAQELAGQCPAKALGRDRAHQWDQVARECRGPEVPEHRERAARAERLGPVEHQGQVVLVEHQGLAALVEHQGLVALVVLVEHPGQAAPVEHQGLAALVGDQAGTKLPAWDLGYASSVPILINRKFSRKYCCWTFVFPTSSRENATTLPY